VETAPLEDREAPIEEHLAEASRRIVIIIIGMFITTLLVFPFSGDIIQFLKNYLLPPGTLVMVLNPMEFIYSRFQISLALGFAFLMPLILYEAFQFMRPGLMPSERRFFLRFFPLSFLFFALGAAFSYVVLTPISMKFLIGYAGETAEPMLVLGRFVSFVAFMLVLVGLIFQLPLIVSLLIKGGLIKREDLKRKRKLVYAGVLVLGIMFSPDPTPVTPFLISLTLVLVYEISIIYTKVL